MATNVSSSFQATIRRQLSKEVLPITTNYLIAHQFAEKKKLEKGAGVTWTATRFNRLPLPAAPLSEGVAPVGETLTISQVTGVALQWGDKVTLTDIAESTTLYDLVQQAKRLLGIQIAETHERNAFAVLMGGTQVNYVNARGSRAAIVAGDVMDTTTINRTYSDLETLGAPFYNGQVAATVDRAIGHGPSQSEKGPRKSEHYVSIIPTLVENDLRQNATIVQAWSYSDVTRLYINEVGYWSGTHFTKSNMMPHWTGNAKVEPTGTGAAGSLAGGTYYMVVTGTDMLNKFGEQQIYQVSAGTVVAGGGTGSINFTTPATSNYTYSIYIGTTTSPVNLATTSSASAPTSGPLSGQATQLPASTAVVLTGTGLFQVPPAAPATGVTVYPTLIFGQQYWACLEMSDVKYTFLGEADKSDPLNQLRVIGWKDMQGYVILNQQFGCRIESSVSNSGTFG